MIIVLYGACKPFRNQILFMQNGFVFGFHYGRVSFNCAYDLLIAIKEELTTIHVNEYYTYIQHLGISLSTNT